MAEANTPTGIDPEAQAAIAAKTPPPAQDRRRGWMLGLGCVAVAALISTLLFLTGPNPAPAEPEPVVWPVSTMSGSPGPQQPVQLAYGRVVARASAGLAAEQQAVVAKVAVREGDRVGAGAVLVELDQREVAVELRRLTARVAQTTAQLQEAIQNLDFQQRNATEQQERLRVADAKLARHEQLRERSLISQALLDEISDQTADVRLAVRLHEQALASAPHQLSAARAERDIAQAELDRSQLQAAKLTLRAPFAAVVTSVSASVGERVLPGTVLVQVADRSSLEVRVPVADQQLALYQSAASRGVQRRDSATASDAMAEQKPSESATQIATTGAGTGAATTADAAPATEGEGTIQARSADGLAFTFDRVGSAVAAGQSQVDAIFRLDGDGPIPIIGSTQTLAIYLPTIDHSVAVPASAIYDGSRIYLVEENALRAVPIQRLGERYDERSGERLILISAAELKADSRVVTTRLPRPQPGLRVRELPATLPAGALRQDAHLRPPAEISGRRRTASAAHTRTAALPGSQTGPQSPPEPGVRQALGRRTTPSAAALSPQEEARQKSESASTDADRERSPHRYRMI